MIKERDVRDEGFGVLSSVVCVRERMLVVVVVAVDSVKKRVKYSFLCSCAIWPVVEYALTNVGKSLISGVFQVGLLF